MNRHSGLQGHVVNCYVAKGRRLHAEALRQAFGWGFKVFRTAVSRAAQGLAEGLRRSGEWRQRRHAIAELQALSDATLRDIGLVRGDIPKLVRELKNGAPLDRDLRHVLVDPAKPAPSAETRDEQRKLAA